MRVVQLTNQAATLDVLLQLIELVLVLLRRFCRDHRLFLNALELHLVRFQFLHELGHLRLLVQREVALVGQLRAQFLIALSVLFKEALPFFDDLLVCLQLALEHLDLLFQLIRRFVVALL